MSDLFPVIGISLDVQSNSMKYQYDTNSPWYALRKNYTESIVKTGGTPILLPDYRETVNSVLSLVDGIVITGNVHDIPPSYYEESLKSKRVEIFSSNRVPFELELVAKALDLGIPILGICHGMQILNVALGGTLNQDIEEQIKNPLAHKTSCILNNYHEITIKSGTKLSELTGYELKQKVNSSHHQSVKKLGKNLRASAYAADGVIEAIEHKDKEFVLGVQWHPEFLATDPLDMNLFKKFIQSARKYKKM